MARVLAHVCSGLGAFGQISAWGYQTEQYLYYILQPALPGRLSPLQACLRLRRRFKDLQLVLRRVIEQSKMLYRPRAL